MELIPHHIVEWFLVPTVMYLLLFWWRDNLSILHMPLADFVALVVVADVAMAINLDQVNVSELLRFIDAHGSLEAPASAEVLWCLAAVGVGMCAVLVYRVENKIFSTVIHHMSVGPGPEPCDTYLPALGAFRNGLWQSFAVRWSAGFGITSVYMGLHALVVGVYPLAQVHPFLSKAEGHWAIEATLVGIGGFLLFLALCALLTIFRIFRFSKDPLPWTYRATDSREAHSGGFAERHVGLNRLSR